MPNLTQSEITHEILSEDIQDIISKPPSWLVRWGLTLFFSLFVGIFILMNFITYPDIIHASFRLTSEASPKSIHTKIEARLTKLHVKNEQNVKQNQILGFLESNTLHSEGLALADALDSLAKDDFYISKISGLDYKNLGELQGRFQTFKTAYLQYISFLSGGFFLQKKALLLQDLEHLKLLEKNLLAQKEIQQKDFEYAQKEFLIHEKLYKDKVIAPLEYNREENKLLNKKMPLQQMESNLIQNQTSQISKQKEILELEKNISEQKSIFTEALKTLQNAISEWKQKYVLIAPIDGKLHFSTFLQEKQYLKTAQELFWISTQNQEQYGELHIPQNNFGKIKTGLQVNIKFSAYPFQEFGMVKGKIDFISEIPQDSIFLAKVSLANGLQTNYKKTLSYRAGMKATAEIITAKNSLIDKIFYQWRKILNN